MLINTTPAFYSHDKAEAIAAELRNGEEDGWNYKAECYPNGLARVAVIDDDGHLAGYWYAS